MLRESPSCIGLLISLHGFDAQSHEAFTGVKGSFAETITNIQYATQAGLQVHTNTVFTHHNYQHVEDIVRLSQALGASNSVFNRYIGQAIPGLDVPFTDLRRAVQHVNRLGTVYGSVSMGTCIPLCFVESASIGCLAGTAYCTIDPWGNLRPCNHAPQIAGNLLTDSLNTLWYSPTMNAWRQMLPADCATCDIFSRCRGGCRADAILKQRNQDPLITRSSIRDEHSQ